MKKILILGAGQSTPFMIDYMLRNSYENEWEVTVCDMNYELAAQRVNGHERGTAVKFDVTNEEMRQKYIEESDLVLNLLAPRFQYLIAVECLHYGKHLITASYTDIRTPELNDDAVKNDMIILNEMGLDPGIDHMSAMKMINSIREKGGYISKFISYGGALPSPEVESNPFKYCITWNPRNVVMSGESGAIFMEENKVKLQPWSELFRRTWEVEVPDVATFEAYPNRDSLLYLDVFHLKRVDTMIRATMRYPGYSETWEQIVKLGIPNEHLALPAMAEKTYAEFTEMFIPNSQNGSTLEARVARYLGISPTGKIMQNLKWLGLFSKEKIGENFRTSSELMTNLLNKKLPLPAGEKDLVILRHDIEAVYPEENRKESIVSTMIDYGDPNGFTAIAKTVGAPAAIAAKLILNGSIKLRGTQIPTHPEIYTQVLEELKTLNIEFKEVVKEIK